MDIIILLILGLLVGVCTSFLGIGGGSIIVPVLYSLYPNISLTVVIPISLGAIFITTLNNSYQYVTDGRITNKTISFNLIITSSIGAIAGALLTNYIDTNLGKKILAIVLIFSVIKILFYKVKDKSIEEKNISFKLTTATGLIGAFVSSITGLGGGIVFTPMLISIVKMPTKLVSPYSNLAMAAATFVGVIPHFFQEISHSNTALSLPNFSHMFFIGRVNIIIILIIASSAYIGSKVGSRFNNKVNDKNKKRILSGIISLLIIKILIN